MKINAQCEAWLGQLTESPVFKKKKCCGVSNGLGFGFALQMKRGGEFSEQGRKSNCVSGVRGGF